MPAFAAVTMTVVSCSPPCTPALRYSVPDGPDLSVTMGDGAVLPVQQQGVNVSGYEVADCWITFSHGSMAAEYHLAPLPPESGQLGVPPPIDPYACIDPSLGFHEDCEVIKGPTPSECFRTRGCLVADFGILDTGPPGALFDYLGSTTYDVTVLCGNDFIVRQVGLSAKGQICLD